MAAEIQLIRDDITRANGGSKSSGRTFVRTLFYEHNDEATKLDLIISNRIPKWGVCHEVYTWFYVTEVGDVLDFSDNEWYVEITYSDKTNGTGAGYSPGTKPWDLPPLEVTISPFDHEVAMDEYWDQNTRSWRPFVNSAGTRLIGTKMANYVQMTFTMNKKKATHNSATIINSSAETVCGIDIPAFSGKLLPFTSTIHTVTDASTGKVEYQYVSQTVTIHISGDPNGFAFSVLDVGTLSRNTRGELGAHYRYRVMNNGNDSPQTSPSRIGTIEDVVAQRKIYVSNGGKINDFPFEEYTEPLPLANGVLDLNAIAAGQNAVYNKITGYQSRPQSWGKFNLPRKI